MHTGLSPPTSQETSLQLSTTTDSADRQPRLSEAAPAPSNVQTVPAQPATVRRRGSPYGRPNASSASSSSNAGETPGISSSQPQNIFVQQNIAVHNQDTTNVQLQQHIVDLQQRATLHLMQNHQEAQLFIAQQQQEAQLNIQRIQLEAHHQVQGVANDISAQAQ